MRTIKKQISVLLAVLMVLSSIMAVSFSVSAAETTGGTITVKSKETLNKSAFRVIYK